MSDSFNRAVVLYALGVAVWALWRSLRGAAPSRGVLGATVVLELALLAQAAAAAASLLAGSRAAEPATFAGYLAASVLVLPVAIPAARAGTRWDSGVIAVVSLALAVICVRLRVTWRG